MKKNPLWPLLLFLVLMMSLFWAGFTVFERISEESTQKFVEAIEGKTLQVTLESKTETRYGLMKIDRVQKDRGTVLVTGKLEVPPPLPECTISSVLEVDSGYIVISWKCPGDFLPPERLHVTLTDPPNNWGYSIYATSVKQTP